MKAFAKAEKLGDWMVGYLVAWSVAWLAVQWVDNSVEMMAARMADLRAVVLVVMKEANLVVYLVDLSVAW